MSKRAMLFLVGMNGFGVLVGIAMLAVLLSTNPPANTVTTTQLEAAASSLAVQQDPVAIAKIFRRDDAQIQNLIKTALASREIIRWSAALLILLAVTNLWCLVPVLRRELIDRHHSKPEA